MSPAVEDVRSYISIKPVPEWKDVVDSKLKARSLQNYTLEHPTREQVFKSNYARRTFQMSSQGYNSPPWKPYQEVGKPLYLSSKTMLQSSLGQQSDDEHEINKENKEDVEKRSCEKSEYKKVGNRTARRKSLWKQGFDSNEEKLKRPHSSSSVLMKHKSPKDLQSIDKDLNAVRENLARVKMGHALFPMLEMEHNDRHNAFLVDRQNELRSLREGMRVHSIGSDIGKQDLDDLRAKSASGLVSSRTPMRMASGRASVVSAISTTSAGSATGSMVARKAEVKKTLAEQARPYTPVYANISHSVEAKNSHQSIWRQLCALHWILESCHLETKSDSQYHHKVMTPLSECWDQLNPGGRTRDSRILLQERKNKTKWTKFTRSPSHKLALSRNRNRRKNPSFFTSGLRKNTSIASDLGGLKRNPSIASDIDGLRKNISVASELGAYQGDVTSRQGPPPALSATFNVEGDDIDGDLRSEAKQSRPSSPGQSSVTTTIVGGTVAGSEYGDDEFGMDGGHLAGEGDKKKEQDEWITDGNIHEHLKKLLSTVKESITSEMQRRERKARFVAKANNRLPISVHEWARSSYFKIGNKEINITKIIVPAATPVTDYSEPRPFKKSSIAKIRPHTAAATRSKNPNILTFNDAQSTRPGTAAMATKTKSKRPMSSPARLASQYTFKFSSAEKEKHLDEIREQFEEVNDAKALQLHNHLTELEKRRKQRMEIKFETLSKTSSIYRDLKGMRNAAQSKYISERETKKKRSCMLPCDWYNTLTQNLPEDVHSDEGCNTILEKLGMMAIEMVDDMRRITPDLFLTALRSLRPWELCSPDVSSAMEFVRENVVQMDASEFDSWRAAKIGPKEIIVGSDRKLK